MVRKIRIISGQWRGWKFPVLNRSGLRPTTSRMRETLFNWLVPFIEDSHCLDCFAGTGALGLEALSRYAASATLLEIKREVAEQLQKNRDILKALNVKVINVNTLDYLAKPGTPYDIVFVDPPFRKGLLEKTLKLLEKEGWLANDAFVYVESEIENKPLKLSINWNLYREKISGRVLHHLYHYYKAP